MLFNKIVFEYFRMNLIHIFLFLNFAATLALGDTSDCYFRDQTIRRLEKKLSKIANKYNGEYESEFMSLEIQYWLLDPVNYTYLNETFIYKFYYLAN